MTNLQKIQLRQSEVRSAMSTLLDKAERSDEDRAQLDKLSNEAKAIEIDLRAAVTLESVEERQEPQAREWADVMGRFDLAEMFSNVMESREQSGPIAEIQTERGLGSRGFPTQLLMEKRAVTPAPTDVGQTQAMIEGYVFPQSVAAFMSIPTPIVMTGDQTFPVLTSDPAAGTPAENDPQTESNGVFSADVLTPARIQASFFWSREDAARMAGMDVALREALQGGLVDKLDSEIMRGTNGLLTGTNLPNNARAAASDYAHYVAELLYGRVDGQYAGDLSDVRVVMGSATFANAATKLPTMGEVNALARIRNDSGGVRVSAHVPAVTNADKQNALVRLGARRDMVAPVWGAITLIPDEITKAANGQIVLTAVLLHAVKIQRKGGFYKQETNHS